MIDCNAAIAGVAAAGKTAAGKSKKGRKPGAADQSEEAPEPAAEAAQVKYRAPGRPQQQRQRPVQRVNKDAEMALQFM